MKRHLAIAGIALASTAATQSSYAQQASETPAGAKPRVNTVTLSKEGLQCNLPIYSGFAIGQGTAEQLRKFEIPELITGEADFCSGEAPSVELNFQVDMFGSKVVTRQVDGRRVSTDAGKYVVVTVSPNAEGGAGWHLADRLRYKQDFASVIPGFSGRARAESLGPFANRYQFWVKKPSQADVRLVDRFPSNLARNVSIEENRGITVGLTGSIGGRLSGSAGISGPVGGSGSATPTPPNGNGNISAEVSGQLEGAIQQTNSRKLSYTGTEYAIENKSTSRIAKWAWDLRLDGDQERVCDYLIKRDLNTCFFTLPLLDTGRIANQGKFSAATYGNFLPAFQAVFKAPLNYAATTAFEVGTDVEIASFVSTARPAWTPALLDKPGSLVPGLDGALMVATSLLPDVLKFDADLKSTAVQEAKESFSVDWSQPYFAPEQNIRLQSVTPYNAAYPETKDTMCLAAALGTDPLASSYAVSFEPCKSPRRGQTWGYDAEEKQFKSRAVKGTDYCLTYPNLDWRIRADASIVTTDRLNRTEIQVCRPGDNTQKWVLDNDGVLRPYAHATEVALAYHSQEETIDQRSQRVRYTAMTHRGAYTQKIKAFPATF